MTAPAPIVQLKNVSKSFGKAVALAHLDLDIAPGEFVTFLGPSGCGKSTTLRLLGGFETPATGKSGLGGHDETALTPHRRNVKMVCQDYARFPRLTVRQ